MKLPDIFRRKSTPLEKSGLEKAKELGLITQEEVLILEIGRAQKKLKEMGGYDPQKRSHHRQP